MKRTSLLYVPLYAVLDVHAILRAPILLSGTSTTCYSRNIATRVMDAIV